MVVVCGTVFMMVDIREELGFDEPRVRARARRNDENVSA